MATGVQSWSQTAASNNTADSNVNWAEGQAPSSVNDSARAMMASVAKWRDDLNGTNATTGGTTAYVLTSDQTFAALAAGLEVAFQINATNTGTTTLNVDSLGAKPLRSAAGVELLAGSLLIGAVYRATYFTSNSGEWLIHGYPVLGDAQIAAAKLASDAVTTAKILDANVTLAKLADLATKTLIGRDTTGTDVPEAVTVAQVLNWLGTAARGDIIRQGAANPERLALGTSGFILTSDGTDAGWATPTIFKLDTQTASAASAMTFVTGISSTYRKYIFDIDNLVANTAATTLSIEVTDDGGSSWKQTAYLSSAHFLDGSGPTLSADSSLTTAIRLTPAGATTGTTAGIGYSGTIEFHNPASTTTRKTINTRGTYLRNGGTAIGLVTTGGFWNGGNGALNGLRIVAASGTVTGTGTLYGIV